MGEPSDEDRETAREWRMARPMVTDETKALIADLAEWGRTYGPDTRVGMTGAALYVVIDRHVDRMLASFIAEQADTRSTEQRIAELEAALELVEDCVVFVHRDESGVLALTVNCNDLFIRAGDEEPLPWSEVVALRDAYRTDRHAGDRWAVARRGMRPLKPLPPCPTPGVTPDRRAR